MSFFRRILPAHLAFAVALSMAFAPVHAIEVGPPDRATPLSAIRIGNFGQLTDAYYRGAQPEGRDYADLATLGVKTVIDLQADFEPTEEGLVKEAGMQFVRIPMTTHKAPTDGQLAQFLQVVNDPASQPVYVHCAGGRHRTGVMTALYRMTVHAWPPDKAYEEMKSFDFGPSFLHPEFKSYVYAYRAASSASAVTLKPVQ